MTTQNTNPVDTFNYPHGVTVRRGKMGRPSEVELDWIVCDEYGKESECKLTLTCELVIDEAEGCRELTISAIRGDAEAVAELRQYIREFQLDKVSTEILTDTYEGDQLHDAATGLGMALLLDDYTVKYPDLFVVVSAQVK